MCICTRELEGQTERCGGLGTPGWARGLLPFSSSSALCSMELYSNKWCNYRELRGGEGLMPKQSLLISNFTASSGFLCMPSPPLSRFLFLPGKSLEGWGRMDGDQFGWSCPGGGSPAAGSLSRGWGPVCLPLTGVPQPPQGCRQLLPPVPCSPAPPARLPGRHRAEIIVMIPDKALSGIMLINLNRQLIKKIKINKPQARARNLIQGY